MEKEFSKFEITAIKRTAANVDRYVQKKAKLLKTLQEVTTELELTQTMIDRWQGPIKEMTGGFTTESLIKKTKTDSGTKFELIYPETIVPDFPTEGLEEGATLAIIPGTENTPVYDAPVCDEENQAV